MLEERWGSRRRERDRGPVLLQPAAPASSRPQPGLRAGWPRGELGNRFSSASPLSLPLPPGRQKARTGRGPRDGLGTGVPIRGPGSGAALAFLTSLCTAFAWQAPELARDRGGAGGREGGVQGAGEGGGARR